MMAGPDGFVRFFAVNVMMAGPDGFARFFAALPPGGGLSRDVRLVGHLVEVA